MHGIERRARRELFTFTFIDPLRYVGLEHYRPENREFIDCVGSMLPTDWKMSDDSGVWCGCSSPDQNIPRYGFKIHLSATCDNGLDLLRVVVPIFVEHNITFKFLVDCRILDFFNSQTNIRSQCGKFITAYPRDPETFKALAEKLDRATRDFHGPYILSDKRLDGSKVVFYRYGAFISHMKLNVFGEKESYYLDDSGSLQEDRRSPFFTLPEGVTDPFAAPAIHAEASTGTSPILNGRYQARAVLAHSSKGGVYVCTDLRTGDEVIVKEARPLINKTRANPHDAIATLRNEWRVLHALSATGYTPRPIEHFQEWEHEFIAMEKIPGVPLSAYRAYESFSIMLQSNYDDAHLRGWCEEYLDLAAQLLDAVRAIHACGVVLQDLAPQNVLVHERRIRLIDFESAYHYGAGEDALLVHMGTVGYSRTDIGHDYMPVPEDDYGALSGILTDLLFPVTLLFVLKPEAKAALLDRLCREKGIPRAIADMLLGMGKRPRDIDALMARARASVESATVPQPLPAEMDGIALEGAAASIAHYMDATLALGREHQAVLPTCYRWYATNPISLAYGYCGIAQFLLRQRGSAPQALVDAILSHAREATPEGYPPGLFVGLSGIAWTLESLGYRDNADFLMRMAKDSPLLDASADIFYGASGFGLACLYFHSIRPAPYYIEWAIEAERRAAAHLLLGPDDTLCVSNLDDIRYNGFAHGASGVALFLLRLYQATGDRAYLDKGERLLAYEISQAEEQHGVLTWPRSSADNIHSAYYRNGNSGIGSVLLRYHRTTGNMRYLRTAELAAEYLIGKYSVFPGLTDGMTGIAEFLLDMYLFTGDQRHRDEALRYADRLRVFMIETQDGAVFPGDELIRLSTDYASGSSGIGMFFLRLANGGPRLLYDFGNEARR